MPLDTISYTNTNRIRRVATCMQVATLALLVGMFIGTHLPYAVHAGLPASDKTIHFWAYLSLSFFLLTSWDLTQGRLQPIHYFLVWLGCTLYGAFDEITQIPVGRTCDGLDWLFDVFGIIAGLALFRLVRPLIYRLVLLLPDSSCSHQ